MVVHRIGAELGVVQLRQVPAQGDAELAAVLGVIVLDTRDEDVGVGIRQTHVVGNSRRQVEAGGHQAVVAALRKRVVAKEGAAVVSDGLVPLELVEGLGGEVLGQALGDIEQVDRNQAFLHLGTRTAQRGGIDRVDRVDAVLDEGAFTPAHHLLAQAHVARQVGEVVVVVDEAVEEHRPGRLRRAITAAVVDVVEVLVAVLQLEVVPVLATHEGTAIAVFQLQVMHALEDGREVLATLEVPAVVVGGTGRSPAIGGTAVVGHEILVGAGGGPAAAYRQRRIELPLDLPNGKVHGLSLRGDRQGYSGGQGMRSENSAHCYCWHAVLQVDVAFSECMLISRRNPPKRLLG
ncbi:hypothetical protein D9M71_141870 [compost metagenome]